MKTSLQHLHRVSSRKTPQNFTIDIVFMHYNEIPSICIHFRYVIRNDAVRDDSTFCLMVPI